MLQFQVIGNLGADAEIKDFNGNKAVCFNVAHTERWTDEQGTKHEQTTWISCILNGDGGRLLPYLKKGASVFAEGVGSARCYSSPKEHKFVAGLNLTIRHIELIGGKMDEVPRELYTKDGGVYQTGKAYFVGEDGLKASGATDTTNGCLVDKQGNYYVVDKFGYVKPQSEGHF